MAGLRLPSESGTYHVISRGNNRSDVFLSPADKFVFLKVLLETKERIPYVLHHYVLMDNHVHLIMGTESPERLSKVMKTINERHAMRFRRRHGGSGHVWQGRFKSFPVHDDAYLLTCGAYIELNPVRAGMVAAPEDYRWSSYHHYATGRRDPLVDESVVFETLGGTREECGNIYRQIVLGWMRVPRGDRIG